MILSLSELFQNSDTDKCLKSDYYGVLYSLFSQIVDFFFCFQTLTS